MLLVSHCSARREFERASVLKPVTGKTEPVLNLKDFARERGISRQVQSFFFLPSEITA
jgi:hypothetical protein